MDDHTGTGGRSGVLSIRCDRWVKFSSSSQSKLQSIATQGSCPRLPSSQVDCSATTWIQHHYQSMAPPSGLHHSTIPSEPEIAFPPLVRSSTVPVSLEAHHGNPSLTNLNHHSQHQFPRADPSHLAPEDAFTATSPPRRLASFDHAGSGGEMRPRRLRRKEGGSRSRSRRRKRFQKLLWVKQSCMSQM